MQIELNKPVVTRDGEQIGQVDRLIVDQTTLGIREFMVQHGMLLQTDRIIDIELVNRIEPDGTIHISISSDEVDSLPPFVEDRYVAPGDHEMATMPQAWVGGAGGGPLFWGAAGGTGGGPYYSGATGPARGEPGHGSMFEPAPVNPTPTEPDRPIDEQNMVIDQGTNVVGKDGDSLGNVDEVIYDANGKLNGFRVKAGFIFKKDVVIGLDMVDQIRPDAVQLSVTADEAEAAGATD